MFVTSDILDLKRTGSFTGFEWRENLICGVAVHASTWVGYQAAARFLYEAAHDCGLDDSLRFASYLLLGEKVSRAIAPKSFPRLIAGGLRGARNPIGVLLKGVVPADGTQNGGFLVGGDASALLDDDFSDGGRRAAADDRSRPSRACFGFPLNTAPLATACAIMRMAVALLDVEYGYYFVRDQTCGPLIYDFGIMSPVYVDPRGREDALEIGNWWNFSRSGGLWSRPWPTLRDLFEVNLLSERHLTTPVDGFGRLSDWIMAEPGRGRLEDAGKGRFLWILSDAEMIAARPLLHHAGLLLSCRGRVYRNLPGRGQSGSPDGASGLDRAH
jgi:hypothetical protein